jgi:hypothetical protein
MATNTLAAPSVASGLRVGMIVQWNPLANPGMDERTANDRGRVLSISGTDAHFDMLRVVWDSALETADPDRLVSSYAVPVASTRVRRVFYGTEQI